MFSIMSPRAKHAYAKETRKEKFSILGPVQARSVPTCAQPIVNSFDAQTDPYEVEKSFRLNTPKKTRPL